MRFLLAPSGDFRQYEARFAIVGATTFCGSVCRVISVVVTVFELIAVPRLILPLALATLTANYFGAATFAGISIFESILVMKKIPAMPTLFASRKALQNVTSALNPKLLELAVPRFLTVSELKAVQDRCREFEREGLSIPVLLPVIETFDSMRVVCGAFRTEELEEILNTANEALTHNRKTLQGSSPGSLGAYDCSTPISEDSPSSCGSPSEPNPHLSKSSKQIDLIQVIAGMGILETPRQISSDITLKQAYLETQASSREGPMLVMQHGSLVGILPKDDLVKIAEK